MQGVLLATLLIVGANRIAAVVLLAGIGFAFGMVPVGWSTWLTRTIPDRAESGGGILVAAIQASMLAGAVLGGAVIDGLGITGVLLASAAIMLISAVHSTTALRPRTTQQA
jgi:predicted MFS family arabinose efflux permease